jgi:hypothetical protein
MKEEMSEKTMKIGIETMKGNKRREEERRAKEIKTTKT